MVSAIILAGGLGTRLRSAVPDLPKPMAPINGRPFLEYQLDYWIEQGISHFILSVGYRHEIISGHFGNKYKGASLEYVVENTPLGTGGGLLLAAERLNKDESFLLLNGDTYFEVDLNNLIEISDKNDADWCFSLFRTNDVERYLGLGVSDEGMVSSLKTKATQTECLANGGVYWVNPRAILNENFKTGDNVSLEDDIFQLGLDLGQRFYGLEFPGAFIDIGIPKDYHRASTLLSNH